VPCLLLRKAEAIISKTASSKAMRMHKGFILTGVKVVEFPSHLRRAGDEATHLQAILRTRMVVFNPPKRVY
jgi:hypothetical protein